MNLNRQLLKNDDVELIVSGEGDSITKAVSNIFRQVRKEIYKEINKAIINMETKEVYFDSIDTDQTKIQKLLNGKKNNVKVEARIILNVSYLDINEEEIN